MMQTLQQQELLPQAFASSEASAKRISPFVKWAGGKRHLLSHLLPLVPVRINSYYEPFLGGGALFFAMYNRGRRFKAQLSDKNGELINAYKITRDTPDELVQYLSELKRHYVESPNKKAYYYEIRKWNPMTNEESAAKFIFLNKTCYNGLFRVNKRNQFNVPFGHNKKAGIFSPANIYAVSTCLRRTAARIYVKDYKKAVVNCEKEDFVYFDPPYFPATKTETFTDYATSGFTEDDQIVLAEWFESLDDRGCNVLLSNSDTPLVRRLYRRYKIVEIQVVRPISCIGNKRRGFREVVIYNKQRLKEH